MLQGIRASTLTMPSFGHDMSLGGVPKVDGYNDADSWSWPQQPTTNQTPYPSMFESSMYTGFTPQMQQTARQPLRHQSIASSRVVSTAASTPPPPRPQVAGSMVKAQPAFKPTWHGFLDTTKDAMTVVEAALQGRLSHISRRPHDKERAEMLTSGTVLVYEENASGIKRWTDAVHWSPSRVMNNCLIYRQLVRALKPEEKKSALNPSCGSKRKRKESSGPVRSKTGEMLENSEDEYENQSFDPSLAGDADPMNKVYANFAQSLTPDQQRRFCGSLIDSYEFKEGGLMKKTISVKYQGTHHHVISYYSLEDVVSGKLKRPFQDPKLADIQPRPELLSGWKVSLEDEESKDMPLITGYPHHIQPSHVQHHVLGAVTQALGAQGVMQTHTPLHLGVPEYWHGSQYTSTHNSPQHYGASQSAHQYPVQQPSPQTYTGQQHYAAHPPSPQQFSSPHTAPSSHYPSQSARHYSYDHPSAAPSTSYSHHGPTSQYQAPQPTSYPMAQPGTFEPQAITAQSSPVSQQPSQIPVSQASQGRRSSAPIALQPLPQTQYPSAPHPHSYYVTDEKYVPEEKYNASAHPGY
ncbi:hypothetical protein GGP41_007562 [Bipolaris sorokiniana]|uniref:Camp independent regulatory protein n=2 Tax=Cochliobolus sativus TaxID=45130 RepID=A0A8H5Z8K3_COCSA|nr:hypothetical protein GGP41_007562 [Bipolaris sorokiniana]